MPNPAKLPALEQYQFTERLGESLQAIIYRGYHKHVPEYPLVIKYLKPLNHWRDQSRYLKQKIERLKVLHDPRACTPLALETNDDGQFIIQPWFRGIPLDIWRQRHPEVNLRHFFSIACNLADILQVVHDAGILHGGIKPHNILIQEGNLNIRLTDFITPLDIRNVSHFIYDPEFVRHTLAYTSPEQTGRINYRVDLTADLYSLGVVFFELLTGRLPFFAEDPLELIHAHLAAEAAKVNQLNPKVPATVASIVAQLLQKQPEKRYQSAAGLNADLLHCQKTWYATGKIPAFALGQHDRNRRVVFISKMVGRQSEIQRIQHEYDAVMRGEFRALFIAGFSGIGKTRLIQELQAPLVRHRGYFTAGKFDQYQKNIPYSSLIQALRTLVRTLLSESDQQLQHWRSRILAAVGSLGGVITDVVPELEFIIDQQPEPPHLPPVEARNRFNNLFSRFLACLASADNPLVLFIDDLQWCDTATFDVLNNLLRMPDEHPYLLLIGAYRHNEVDSAHPLVKLLKRLDDSGVTMTTLQLGALSEDDSHEMVAYILDSPMATTRRLAYFIAQLTEGNPLFISESLAWLHTEGLLGKDGDGHWHWDMQRIRNARMPSSVVDLFSAKVRKLPTSTLTVLDHCACLGNQFGSERLGLILGLRIEQLFEQLKPVLSLGLLLENKNELQFVHDRVQEAVLKQIAPDLRTAMHWRIGEKLLAAAGDIGQIDDLDDLFSIVAHLNLGAPTTLATTTAYCLAQINFHAGNKALDALASDAANDFFQKAHAYLPDGSWQHSYELSFRIYQKLAKTNLMCGRYEQSEALLEQLLQHAANDLDKAEALADQTTSLSSFGNFNQAIATANRGLAYFDKAIPDDAEVARQRLQNLMTVIDQRSDVWHAILHMPFTEERKSKIELAFYSELIPDLYMCGRVAQLYLSAAQSTLHCLDGGMDESVIYSFSIMGLNLGEQGHFEQAFRYQDLAHELCARYPDTFGATRGMNGIVWCNMHSRSHPADIADYAHKAIQCGKNCGDLYNAGLSYGPLMWNLIAQGHNLRLVEDAADECLNFSRKNQLSFSVGLAEAVMAGWINTFKPGKYSIDMTATLARWSNDDHVASTGSYYALKGFALYYLGEYQTADQALQSVALHLHGLTDNVLKRLWYAFTILNRLRLPGANAHGHGSIAAEADLEAMLLPLRTWAGLGPLLTPFIRLIDAECARYDGHYRDARNLYLDALEAALMQNYGLLSGHIYELLADLVADHGFGDAEPYYDEARRHYRLCRADLKGRRLQDRHPYINRKTGARVAKEKPQITTLPNLDIDYLMKSALALAAEIDLRQLMQKIMAVVLESSGAQNGYLLMKQGDVLNIVSERHAGHANVGGESTLCQAIVNYAQHTQKKVVLRDAAHDGD
ncbi:MAG: phytochrome sensor protein, partial [Methylomonas sp.]